MNITDRRGLIKALNKHLGTECVHSRYVGVRIDNMMNPPSPRTRLIFRHVNGVGHHIEVVSWNGPGSVGIPSWMKPYVSTSD